MIQNLPQTANNGEIKEAMYRAGVDKDNIIYVNRCYKFSHIWKLKKKEVFWIDKFKHLQAFREHMKELGVPDSHLLYPKRKILGYRPFLKFPREKRIHKELNKIQQKLKMRKYQIIEYCGIAFVVFKTEADVKKVIDFYRYKCFRRNSKRIAAFALPCLNIDARDNPNHLVHGKRIKVVKAPEPGDVIWENLEPNSKRWWTARAV